jgi:DNA-binding NarL/FixJ family response regulator
LGDEIIRVAVVDDQRLFARGLSGLVELLPSVEVVGVAYNGEEAITLCRKEEPDVVLMDISMPKMDGISATREIKALLPRTAVVILTGHEEDEHVFEGGRPVGSAHLAPPLTERELEVIKALAQGMSDRQIARSLGISEKTVRNHTSNIYRKLHIFDRTRAVIYAVREGVIDIRDLEYRPPSES